MKKNELKYGMQPFWFWNGEMKEEEIVRQIEEMKEKGVEGFFIHPRQGMELPYLSKEYFEKVKLAVRAAKERDMEVWIYDEYPYPSGISGGEVILDHPEFLCKKLEKAVLEEKGGQMLRLSAPWGKVLLARAYPVRNGICDFSEYVELSDCVGTGYSQEVFQYSGLTQYNKKRYFTGDPVKLLQWDAPEGNWKVYLVTEAVFKHFKYFENFIDPLNPEAVKYFLETTYEKYKKYIGEEFGKTIKGFFTDEVTAFPDSQPWSPLLPQQVKERHGIDLIQYLPALWEDMGEITPRVRYAYWSTATDCFIESYDRTVYNWCEENHLLYIGEKPIMRSKELQYVHIPGIDAGHQKVGSKAKVVSWKYRANGKMAASAAHFYGKPAALCEAGHSIGWGMTLQDMKWIFDWLAVQGIDFYVIHGFFYTTDGLKKHDAPPSAFYQMPWWRDAKNITAYGAKLGELQRSSNRRVSVLVLDPVTSVWTLTKEQKLNKQEEFARLQNEMLEQQLDYYIIDPELFAQAAVETTGGKTVLRIGKDSYDMVVLPYMTSLESGACKKAAEFISKGGNVCAVSTLPYEKIEEGSALSELRSAWKKNQGNQTFLADTRDDFVKWARMLCKPEIAIVPEDAYGMEELLSFQGNMADGAGYIFVVNVSSRDRKIILQNKDGKSCKISLEPYEAKVCTAQEIAETTERSIQAEGEEQQIILDVEKPMQIELSGRNALRLGDWLATLPDGQSKMVESVPVIDQMESADFQLPVVQKKYFGCPKELEFPELEVTYETDFVCEGIDLEQTIYLVMEPDTFLGDWEIFVNGHSLKKEDFKQKNIYLPTNLAIAVQKMLRQGENHIRVHICTNVSYGGMRNPLYLFGDFGVQKEKGWKLVPFRPVGYMKDMAAAGLPFYYGELAYSMELPLTYDRNRDTVMKIKAPWLTDSVRLKIGEYVTEPVSFRPYTFKIPGGAVSKNDKELTIFYLTTAIGLFEGESFNQEKHAYEKVFDL